MSTPPRLTNEYARDYYDAQVAPLSSYEEQRWHSTPVQEFEYRQTKRALKAALGDRPYRNGVEIGPGDGVWTLLLREKISGILHLVEQSQEMLSRAQDKLASARNITFERSDILASNPPAENDLVVAVRCFEYFEDKPAALKKMRALLAPGGRIVIITKNPRMFTTAPAQSKPLHSDQVSQARMRALATEAGLRVEQAYPAVLRWGARYAPARAFFDICHRLAIATRGWRVVPSINTYAVESYVYILSHAL